MREGLPSGFSHNCGSDHQIVIALQLDAPHHFFSADGEKAAAAAAAPGEGLRWAKTKTKKKNRKNKKGGKATELEVS